MSVSALQKGSTGKRRRAHRPSSSMTSHFLWLKQNCFTVSLAQSISNKSLCRGNASGCKAPGKLDAMPMCKWNHSLCIQSLQSAKVKGRACPNGSLGARRRKKLKWSRKKLKQRHQSKQQWNISFPCREKRHIQVTQLVRLDARSYTQPFLKRLWIWLKLELHNRNQAFTEILCWQFPQQRNRRKPCAGDRAFDPLNEDIRNHVRKAKTALELSKYDQENLW